MAGGPSALLQNQIDWYKRNGIGGGMGLTPGSTYQLQQNATTDVLHGGQPIGGRGLNYALLSQAQGKPLLTTPPPGSSITDIPRNAGMDLAHIVTGFFPGIYNFATHLPSEARSTMGDIQKLKPINSASNVGYDLRDLASSPILSLAPGLTDVANLTSAQGRKQFTEHPLYSLMDVMPYIGKAGEMAALSRGATVDSMDMAAKTATPEQAAINTARLRAGDLPSASSALAAGKTGKALFRVSSDSASAAYNYFLDKSGVGEKFGIRPVNFRLGANNLLMNSGLHPFLSHYLARPFDYARRSSQSATNDIISNTLVTPAIKALNDEEQTQLSNFAQTGMTPENLQILQNHPSDVAAAALGLSPKVVKALPDLRLGADYLGDVGKTQNNLIPVFSPATNREELMVSSSPIARLHRAREALTSRIAAAKDSLDAAQARVDATGQVIDLRSKSYPHFEKSPSPGINRHAPTPPSLENLAQAARYLSHRFDSSPEAARASIPGLPEASAKALDGLHATFTTKDRGQIQRDLVTLSGPDGLFSKIQAAAEHNDLPTMRTLLRRAKSTFRHAPWQKTSFGQDASDYLDALTTHLQGHNASVRSFNGAQFLHNRATDALAKRTSRYESLVARHAQLTEKIAKTWETQMPARFVPTISKVATKLLSERLDEALQTIPSITPAEAEKIRSSLASDPTMRDAKIAIGKSLGAAVQRRMTHVAAANAGNPAALVSDLADKVFLDVGNAEVNKIVDSAVSMWQDLARQGHDPIFLPYLPPGTVNKAARVNISLSHPRITPAIARERVLNLAPGEANAAVQLAHGAAQLASQAATKEFHDTWTSKFGESMMSIAKRYHDALSSTPKLSAAEIRSKVDELVRKNYVEWDTVARGPLPKGVSLMGGDKWMVPRSYTRALDMMSRGPAFDFNGIIGKGTKLFAYSVLTGPRHMVHIAFGGLMAMMVKDPVSIPRLLDSFRAYKLKTLPAELHDSATIPLSPTEAWNYQSGHLLARIGRIAGKPAEFFNHVEEFVSNIQRGAVYLHNYDKAIKAGEDATGAKQAALYATHKTLVDMAGATPLERVIMKQVFPFYGFMRYSLGLVFSMPSDHPLRASILTQFASQEEQEWNKSLPQMMQTLVYLGHPNAHRNQQAIDLANMNPFRSIASMTTLQGFISGMSPFLQLAPNISGLTANSYAVQVNPFTGKANPQANQIVPNLISTFVPEFKALDYYANLTQSMKMMKWTNPYQAKKIMLSSLNIPFYHGPVNLPYMQERFQQNLYSAATQALNYSIRFGDWSYTDRFSVVPWNGRLVPPRELQSYFARLKAESGGKINGAALAPHIAAPPAILG